MTDKPAIAALLATGRMDFETPTGWHAADLGLRAEIIDAALKTLHLGDLHEALAAGRQVTLRDDALDFTVRWSPG